MTTLGIAARPGRVDEEQVVARDEDLLELDPGAVVEALEGTSPRTNSSCSLSMSVSRSASTADAAGQEAVLAVRDELELLAGRTGRAGRAGLGRLRPGAPEDDPETAANAFDHVGDGRAQTGGWVLAGRTGAHEAVSSGTGARDRVPLRGIRKYGVRCTPAHRASIRGMTDETEDPAPAVHRPTLMTVHAHPDDETIGTGGAMAKAVAAGHRVVLVTGTRGELGEIVVPDMDTPDNHRRLGEIRAGELERAMGLLGVTEWENLGYRDSGMMGTDGNRDPRSFWQADLDEAAGRLTWLVRRYQPDVMTTYNEFGGYGHPDHIRTHDVAVRAFDRAGDPAWYPEQLEEPGLDAVGAVQALRAGDPGVRPRADGRADEGARQGSVLGAARGRDAGADRRVRGVRREDAGPRRARSRPGSTSPARRSRRSGPRSTST